MKKIFMLSAAALMLFSCGKDSDFSNNGNYVDISAEGQIRSQYKTNFNNAFGEPAKNENWGFGSSISRGVTRGNAGEDYPATSEGINANANEWADPAKYFGGWVVPDALTEEQKEIVTKYFQSHPNLGFEDPEFRHFFVQQVYTGGDAQDGESSETITAANGSTYTSANMNLLTVGKTHQHINNFNAGSYGATGTNSNTNGTVNVLNNGQSVGGTTHEDQIMLMVNIDDTSCFGYHESGASVHKDDKAALVGWETIRDWANSKGMNGDCLNDGWNRSFLGFDHALLEGEDVYVKDNNGNIQYADYTQAPEAPKVAWDGEKVFPISEVEVIKYEYYTDTKYGDYLEAYKTIKKSGESIGWLNTNSNFYVAEDKVTLAQSYQNGETQASSLTEVKDAVIIKDLVYEGTKYQAVLNLVRINELVADGYLPINNKSLTEWVKVGGGDGYYTDWIVTLHEAQRYVEETPSLRVMGEDLSATDASDFDFNDVVIDVQYVSASEVTITLLAAGGTLPLRICQNNNWEVHKLFNVPTTCMVNTGIKYHKANGSYTQTEYLAPVELSYTGFNGWSTDQATFNTQVKEKIILEVEKTTTNSEGEEVTGWYELTAPVGSAPSKIAVPTSYHHAGWYEHADLTDGLRWAWEKQAVDANALMQDAWGE